MFTGVKLTILYQIFLKGQELKICNAWKELVLLAGLKSEFCKLYLNSLVSFEKYGIGLRMLYKALRSDKWKV